MLNLLISLLIFVVGMVLGFYLLLLGRQKMVVTTTITCLAGTSSLLALIFYQEGNGWAMVEARDWTLLAISVAAGVIGGLLGSRNRRVASGIVGFFAGGYVGLWFYDIAHYLIVDIANWPEETVFWVGVSILIIGGLFGLFFTLRSTPVALILITVFMGGDLISRALGMDPARSFTAVVLLSLALLGLVVQYAQYLREIKAEITSPFELTTAPAPAPAPEMFDLSDD